MKQGRYFLIPQHPTDLQRLWANAERLEPAQLPHWLTPEDATCYRRVATALGPESPGQERPEYLAEIEELEAAGLVIDDSAGVRHIYIKEPQREAVWAIGIYTGKSPFSLAPQEHVANPVLAWADVTDVPASYVADPFMLRVGGTWHMFFEVLNWRTKMGEIGLAVSSDGAKWTYRQIVLAEPFHVSYPYVFRWMGESYMIPETHEAGAVRLYKAVDFPTRWAPVATLLEGPYLADASVFRHAGSWWMFVDTSPAMDHATLRLYHAAALMGPWREHPKSPIVANDPRNARPAGRLLTLEHQVVRFAQNSVPNYGTDVRALVIDELTANSYREHEVAQKPVLRPSGSGWNACGMHHVDAHYQDGNWFACVDGWVELGPEDQIS
jgi:hypothetical protein